MRIKEFNIQVWESNGHRRAPRRRQASMNTRHAQRFGFLGWSAGGQWRYLIIKYCPNWPPEIVAGGATLQIVVSTTAVGS